MNINEITNKSNYDFSCIYLWRNLINNKVYVGQTQNFYNRMKQYSNFENNKERLIIRALKKYGFDNFEVIVLEKDIDLDELNDREQYWMDYFQSYDLDKGYNICVFADSTRGYHHTEEDKKKMSELKKQYLKEHPEKILRGEKILCTKNQ